MNNLIKLFINKTTKKNYNFSGYSLLTVFLSNMYK